MAFNATEFLNALDLIEQAKGVSKETVITALEEAMIKGFKKQLGGDDALVRVNIDPAKGVLEMYQIKMVVEDVQDDFLEISLEDAKEVNKKYKVGDEFLIPASVDVIRKAVSSIFKQKFAEAERGVLYDQFKDKINTMITGNVEKIDERGCSVNIGRTSVFLPKKEMIADEKFAVGDNIKLFVSDVATGTKGAHIVVSRANEGFLKCLMSEEIHEVYDGTITIKSIARAAGERSKVAVYTPDINIDPAGACIGPNGSRIQKIVSQLGNGSQKEKIDIITWTENVGLFIMEALKPARVVGIDFDEASKTATIIVKDDALSIAIGRKGVNARLAVKLTGYNIDIMTESEANEEEFEYQTFEELQAADMAIRAQKINEAQREAYLAATEKNNKTSVLPGLPEGYVAPQARKYEDEENTELDEALNAEAEKEETPVFTKKDKAVETASILEEPVKKEAPVEKVKETTVVKTTTTLEDLEKSLESSNKTTKKDSSYKKKKIKKDEEEVEEASQYKAKDPSSYMSIYTEEELKAMEEEDKENDNQNNDDEDIDYDDYDDYYDK